MPIGNSGGEIPAFVRMGLMQAQARGQHNEIQGLAKYGAQQLSQYGQEGQQWAQKLTENPEVALAMAEQFGGFAQIENRLRYGQAVGQSAQGRALDPMALEAYKQQGSTGLTNYLLGLESQAEARSLDAETTRDDVESRFMYGNGGGGSGGLTIGAGGNDWQQRVERQRRIAMGSGKLAEAEKMREQLIFGEAWDSARVDRERENREKRMSSAVRNQEVFESYLALDPNNPIADQALVTYYSQLLDPGSIVREGEARAVGAAGASTVGEVLQRFSRVWDETGVLPEEARNFLRSAIEDAVAGGASALAKQYEGYEEDDQHRNLTDRGRTEVLPFKQQYRAAKQFLQSREPDQSDMTMVAIARSALVEQGIPEEKHTPELVEDVLKLIEKRASLQADPRDSGGMIPPDQIQWAR